MLEEWSLDYPCPTARLLNALGIRLRTPKAELVGETETRSSELLGIEVAEAFRAVATRERRPRALHADGNLARFWEEGATKTIRQFEFEKPIQLYGYQDSPARTLERHASS